MPQRSDANATFEEPMWFGPADRPLFGWLGGPASGRARGGVLLAPPIGQEAFAARHALRRLAEQLAARGYVTLRFDYDGTGDAAGQFDDPGRDRAWVESVKVARDYLSSLGIVTISGVGMRLGATVLGIAATKDELDLSSLVLWDPCESGRHYLRELSALEALRRVDYELDPGGAVETSEFVFKSEAAQEIRGLTLTEAGLHSLADRVLVVSRSDRTISDRLRARLEEEKVDWQETNEHGALFDVEYFMAVVPEDTTTRIAAWLGEDADAIEPFARPVPLTSVVLAHDDAADAVRERCLRVGPRHTFAVITEPEGEASGPWIVLMNSAGDDHTGRARRWVELPRRWAKFGLRSVRFDLSGFGESPSPIERSREMFDEVWMDDLREVLNAISPADPANAVFVGLCSAAVVAVEGALALGPRGVCVVNPPVALDLLYAASRMERSRAARVRSLAQWMKQLAVTHQWVAATLSQTLQLVPNPLFPDVLSRIVDNGTDLLLLACADDLTPRPRTPYFRSIDIRRVGKRKRYEVGFVPGADHGLHNAEGRIRAMAILDDFVVGHFASRQPGRDPDLEPDGP